MKKSLVKLSCLCMIIFAGLFILTGCGDNKADSTNNKKNGPVSFIGEYGFDRITDETGTITAEEWKTLTGIQISLKINNDNTCVVTYDYGNGKVESYTHKYDDKYIYDDENPDKASYSYVFNDGVLKLKDLSKEIDTEEVYKHK